LLLAEDRRHGRVDADGERLVPPVVNGLESLLGHERLEVLELRCPEAAKVVVEDVDARTCTAGEMCKERIAGMPPEVAYALGSRDGGVDEQLHLRVTLVSSCNNVVQVKSWLTVGSARKERPPSMFIGTAGRRPDERGEPAAS
jgi:hypothetical protein